MTDLRSRIDAAIARVTASRAADEVLAEIARTHVLCAKEIWDRVQMVAVLASEVVNAPAGSSISRQAEGSLTHAVDALQPNDLDDARS